MRPIPKKLLNQLLADPRNQHCTKCKRHGTELHHVWKYAGKQINEAWAIVGLCTKCHRGSNGTISKKAKKEAEYESVMRLIESGFENLDKYKKPMDGYWENLINFYTKYYDTNS
jgi:hypothetical protein